MKVDIFNTDKKYNIIYADPPWYEQGGGKIKRGADRHYPLMKTSEIATLPVKNLISDRGAHLYLWVTNNHLQDGLQVMEAWGFEYITIITWLKNKQGLGQYFRGKTEHCLFGVTKKRLPYNIINGKRAQGVTGFYAERGIHSAKPDQMRKMIETVSVGNKIELFARQHADGWDCWGNEV